MDNPGRVLLKATIGESFRPLSSEARKALARSLRGVADCLNDERADLQSITIYEPIGGLEVSPGVFEFKPMLP